MFQHLFTKKQVVDDADKIKKSSECVGGSRRSDHWSRYIYINRYLDVPRNTYANILEVVKNKDYFVLTTNVDHCFQKAGFDHKRLFYTQGDYGLFQCSGPCCKETFDNKEIIINMLMDQGSNVL